jgi:hypothetical protein
MTKLSKLFVIVLMILFVAPLAAQEDESPPDIDMEHETVHYLMRLLEGTISWPVGEKFKLAVDDVIIITDVVASVVEYGSEFKELNKYYNDIKKGSVLLLMEKMVTNEKPDISQLIGKVSHYKAKEDDDSEADQEPFQDDGKNEEGWEDPKPKAIPEDYRPPKEEEESEEEIYQENMDGYIKEGKDAELIVIEGQEKFGKSRRLIIFNNTNWRENNQIGLAFDKQLFEIHEKLSTN